MADNVVLPGTGSTVAADQLAGGEVVQFVKLMDGTADSDAKIAGDATNGLDVDVTRMAALVAGTALIGKVGIDQVTANANEIVVKSGTVTAVTAITNALPAGTNAIGKLSANSGVDIGDVDITSIAAGDNNIGNVDIASIAAGNNNIGDVDVASIAAGDNNIGNVDIVTMPVCKGTGFAITATLTVTNGAYTAADVAGGLITFANAVSANGKSCVINTITLAGVVAIPYELWFLNADIATPAADNAAFTLVAGDTDQVLGVVPIAAADYCAAQSAFNVATIRGVGLECKAAAGTTSIYAYLKATATTSPGTTTVYLTIAGEMID